MLPRTLLSRLISRAWPIAASFASVCAMAAACMGVLLVSPPAWTQIPRATDAPKPHSPEESRAMIRVRDGFEVDLVAAEPLIADPTAIAWDEHGRLFVAELHGYNLEGHLDVVELNKTGVLDREVRRIPASPEAREAAKRGTSGTVKILDDLDGDGRMDRARVIADGLPPCYGIIAARGGVIVTCAPDILYLADRDGDGDWKTRETLFTGLATGVLERGVNNPRYGLDGWIWCARGHGGVVRGPRLEGEVDLGRSDFRFRADGTAIEPVTGSNGTFGLTFDDVGDRFILDTSNHALYAVPLPWRYLARNPFVPGPHAHANAANYQRIFPTSAPHPWRLARSRDPAWVRFYGEAETTPSGRFTSACGQLIYRAALFPPDLYGNHFVCDPQNNLVHRSILERDGAGWRVHRAPDEKEREFLTSDEKWFRPINLAISPLGELWVVDMYREIIEDYSAIPRFLQQQYGLIEGDDRGRIWRVRPLSFQERHEAVTKDLPRRASGGRVVWPAEMSNEDLARTVALDPGSWWRETAQRLLVERGASAEVASILRQELRSRESSNDDPSNGARRIQVVRCLELLGALGREDALAAFSDPHWGVRMHGLIAAERLLDRDAEILERTVALSTDPDPRVRLQAALSLGESSDPRAAKALANLARSHGGERWMSHAIASSARRLGGGVLASLLADGVAQGGDALEPLARTVGACGRPDEIASVLEAVAHGAAGERDAARVVTGLSYGLEVRSEPLSEPSRIAGALGRILTADVSSLHAPALAIARRLGIEQAPELRKVYEDAVAFAKDASRELSDRVRSLELLASAPADLARDAVMSVLDSRVPVDIQLAAIAAVDRALGAEAASLLIDVQDRLSPAARARVIETIAARADRLPTLLDALDAGRIAPGSVIGLVRLRLVESADASVRERARRVFSRGVEGEGEGSTTDVAKYIAALAEPGDASRGRALFVEHCSSCHVLLGEGAAVGADLAASRHRPDEAIVRDILFPNDEVDPAYEAYVATTRDGRILSGVLASESATSIALREARGTEHVVLREEIVDLRATGQSLMPEELAAALAPNDVRDLLAHLRASLGDRVSGRATLFDEEDGFPEKLIEGDGEATIHREHAARGRSSLRVTPLQRYSPRITDWSFRIREHPSEGEYRYLRFAWRAEGHGVLIELADDGAWPPAKSSRRRYHAGRNTSGWASKELGSTAPRDWVIVTVDLFADQGEMTLTGIAPTALGGPAYFDRIELLRSLDAVEE